MLLLPCCHLISIERNVLYLDYLAPMNCLTKRGKPKLEEGFLLEFKPCEDT